MQAQLADLHKEMEAAKAEKGTKSHKPKQTKTPPATHPGPSPASSAKAPPRKAVPARDEPEASDSGEELSHAAKLARLRRLCEMKPSGTCKVPESVHKKWAAKGHSREELLQVLEDLNWDGDSECPNLLVLFVFEVSCSDLFSSELK